MPFLDDVYRELAEVESFVQRRQTSRVRAMATDPKRVDRLSREAQRYPHMTPDAFMALARTKQYREGTAAKLGELSTRQWLRRHPQGTSYGDFLDTPGARRERRGGSNIFRQTAELLGENKQETRATKLAALPEDRQSLFQSSIEAAQSAGLFDDNGVLTEPTSDNKAQRAAWERLSDQFMHAGIDLEYVNYRGHPTRMVSSDRNEVNFRDGKRTVEYVRAGESRVINYDPETDPLRLAVRAQRKAAAGPTGFNALIRAGATTLDMPVQELQGQIRNIYGAAHGKHVDWTEPQSDLLIQAQTGLSAGSGMLVDPESQVADERRRREAERGKIGSHNVTAGRWLADALPFAVDSKPFQLVSGITDLGVQLADPTAFALGKGGKAVMSPRMFLAPDIEEKAGLVRGIRNFMVGPTRDKWLSSAEGMARKEWLAKTNDPYTVWRGLNRKVNGDLATRLADTRSVDEVDDILRKELGTSIRRQSTVSMPALGRDPYETNALTNYGMDMPARGPIDATSRDVVAGEMEKWLSIAGATDEELSKHVGRIMRAENRIEINAGVVSSLKESGGILERGGIADQRLRSKLTALYDNAHEEGSRTWVDSLAHQGQTDNVVVVDGKPAWDTAAHLYIEHAPETLQLPDARNVRRSLSKWHGILAKPDTGELRIGFAAAEFLQNELWKPVQLVTRIAWPIRVIGEEQVRLAAAGYDSMFNHPVSAIAGIMGRHHATDLAGNLIEESHALKSSLTRVHGDWIDRAVPTGRKTVYSKARLHEREQFENAWASEIARLANDPVSKYVANSDDLNEAKTWFQRGAGQKFKSDMAQAHPARFADPRDSDEYIESVSRRLENAHGGNPTLLDAIRTGQWDGKNILDGNHLDTTFKANLPGMADRYAPEKLVGDDVFALKGRDRVLQSWDRTVDKMFGLLMTNPTNKLSRAPMFKQSYWREVERLFPFADEETRLAMVESAKNANIGSRAIRRMERGGASKKVGDLRLHEVDMLAKGNALDETKNLLYDLTKKNKIMDGLRLIFPFGEAWKEVVTRWMGADGLLWRNPKTVRRFQQLVQGARGEELGDFLGQEDGQGFFWENQFGEQVFIYPGSTLLTDKLLGVPVPLTGRVQGLSMFGTVMPGLGPVAQIPVGWLAANKPGPQVAKDFMTDVLNFEIGPMGTVEENLLPFGAVGAEDQAGVASAFNFMPPWVKAMGQFITDGDVNGKQWNTTVMEVAGYLKTTGEYDGSVEDQQRLMEDASKRARGLYLIKALTAGVVPASPDTEFMVETNSGELVRAAALSQELRDLRAQDFNEADRLFLDKYGEDVLGVIGTSMTTSSNYAVPASKAGVQWVMRNPGVEDRLPHTYGFFAPESDDTDLTLYNDNFRKGESIRLNPSTWIRLMNNTIGDMMYREANAEVGEDANTDEGRAYLRDVRDQIWAEYPGWRDESGKLTVPSDQAFISELERAAIDPVVRKTDAGKGLSEYLEGRQQVVDYAASQDRAWPSTAEDMADARAYLRELATWVTERHPGFARLYDYVLSRETETDEDTG